MVAIPTFQLGDSITDAQRDALNEVGAIRFKGVASPEEVRQIQAAVDRLSDHWVQTERDKVNGVPIKYGTHPDGSQYVQRFAFSSQHSDVIQSFVLDPRFESVRRLCGEDCRVGVDEKDGVVINHYRNEPGSRYKALGWHTDGLRDLFYGRLPGPMWNVGFYIDDSPREKGALRLIPGSHRQGFWSMLTRKRYFLDHGDDPEEVCLEAEAGDLTIHDGRLWHRVGRAELEGEASMRRTMYVPYISGPYEPKTDSSPTPLYHYLQWITG